VSALAVTPARPDGRVVAPAAERAERNAAIAPIGDPEPLPELRPRRARLTGLQARRAHHEHLAAAGASAAELDPAALVERVVRGHVLALDRLEALARRADNSSAQVGACRSLASVGSSLIGTLSRVGWLEEPSLARFRSEVETAVAVIFALADAHGIPDDEVSDAVERLPLERAGLERAS